MPDQSTDQNTNNNLLANRIILVTGASDGIGRAAAKCYASHGATVILLGRSIEKLESVYDEIVSDGGAAPAIISLDLTTATEENYSELAETIEDEFGQLNGLLLNAGILGERKPLSQYSATVWQQVMQTNLTSPFMMTKALIPLLEQAESASVIFTSSGVGRTGKAYWGAYAASKFGIEGLTQIWADELANISNIRVNAINPGATRTNMRATAYPAENPTQNPTPEDIMKPYLYLMSDSSRSIQGQSIDAGDFTL
ncbi:MAG: YciK family oxidoreductase [Pseudomonadales bacterium]|nr:YciK family oxidoreductase [Pseudomonadales bacterium]